jgi:dienelactone hydrolase
MYIREYAVFYGPPDLKLDVMMFLPVSSIRKPCPVILFIPKFWKENDDNKEIAKKCIDRGYALCLYNKEYSG